MNKFYSNKESTLNIAIIGAGTIGTVFAWLLSKGNDVDILIKQNNKDAQENGFQLDIKNLTICKKNTEYTTFIFRPNLVTEISKEYDLIIVAVNRYQLSDILPQLKQTKGNAILLFLQNHWNIEQELQQFFSPLDYVLGFPSTIGGGRNGNHIKAIIFNSPTRLSLSSNLNKIYTIQDVFVKSGIKTSLQKNFTAWQKSHYLQQGITAGAILQAGTYKGLVVDYMAIKKMLVAYREGIMVCKAYGVNTNLFFPSNMLFLPLPIVTVIFKAFLNQPLISEMIQGHMKNGLPEWVYGYYEILFSGNAKNLSMENWLSYKPFVDEFHNNYHLKDC